MKYYSNDESDMMEEEALKERETKSTHSKKEDPAPFLWEVSLESARIRRNTDDNWNRVYLQSKFEMYFQRGPLWPGLRQGQFGQQYSFSWKSPERMSGKEKPEACLLKEGSSPASSVVSLILIFSHFLFTMRRGKN
jgi:hypothetical protein